MLFHGGTTPPDDNNSDATAVELFPSPLARAPNTNALNQATDTAVASSENAALASQQRLHEQRAVAVEVPIIKNVEEYDFLPGHSVIRHVLGKKRTTGGNFYNVELESSDKELVSGFQKRHGSTFVLLIFLL
jgi:hypothetical protein